MNKFYITTPIFYVNAQPHIGHTYTTIAADVLARYHRMIGDQTFFLTGTDEHGAKIAEKAKDAGIEVQNFVDQISAKFQIAWDQLNISNDSFIRTTNSAHKQAVQNALQKMYDNGDIYLGKYEGLYCRGCEQYKSEKDLVDGLCPDHKIAPEKMSEDSYMFKMSKYQDELLQKIKNNEFQILPIERKNEVVSFFEKEGLTDVSFSRKNVAWGIPVPWDNSHTIYVWADAFLNYLTGIGWSGSIPLIKGDKGDLDFWPVNVNLIGKDILRVHSTIWPAMLLSLGLPLPKVLFVHGFFLSEGQKMSKSLGNVIAPDAMVMRYGVDATRYLLLGSTPFGNDGDITWEKLDEKFNADLANGLGNLAARSITLAIKMADEKIRFDNSQPIVSDEISGYHERIEKFQLDKALEIAKSQIGFWDNYITTNKPWEMIKNKHDRTGAVLYNILEGLRQIAWLIWPYMPDTADKIWQGLGTDIAKEKEKNFNDGVKWGGLDTDTKPQKIDPLFPRI